MKKTRIFEIYSKEDPQIPKCAAIIKAGGLVAMPTETVYGLAANAFDESAVKKIFEAKGRPADNPLIAHISDVKDLEILAEDIPESAYKLCDAFWPGPLTVILKRKSTVPAICSAGLDTIAVRLPANSVARALISVSGVPLAAPSANLSGSPSPTKAAHVISDLSGVIDAIIKSDDCAVGVESTVISLINPDKPIIYRPGFITKDEISEIIGEVFFDKAVLSQLENGVNPGSPGMKYRHYSPKTKMILIDADEQSYCDFLISEQRNDKNICALCFDETKNRLNNIPFVSYGERDNQASQASGLFSALREVDEKDAGCCYALAPNKSGVGLAVYNRMLRAAAFNVIYF